MNEVYSASVAGTCPKCKADYTHAAGDLFTCKCGWSEQDEIVGVQPPVVAETKKTVDPKVAADDVEVAALPEKSEE